MSGPSERDEIAAVLAKTLYEHSAASTFDATCGTCVREREHARTLSGPLLDWLAERDRRTAAKTLREAADEIEGTIADLKATPGSAELSYINCTLIDVRTLRDRADRIERGER